MAHFNVSVNNGRQQRRTATSDQDNNEKENSAVANTTCLVQHTPADDEDDDDDVAPNNDALADALKELGKLHQKCPINDDDTWKAYALDKIAGRIRHLDFQVTLERESQLRLKGIHGIGASTLEKVNQFLQTGQITRTKEFRKDPERVAMKAMMGIWGVGRKTVRTRFYAAYVVSIIWRSPQNALMLWFAMELYRHRVWSKGDTRPLRM